MKAKAFLSLLLLIEFLSLFPSGAVVAGTLQDVKGRGKLIAGVKTDYPPLGFLDKKGIHKGLDIDISKVLSKELFGNENAVEFVSVTSENRIPLLTSARVDLLAATLTITEERKKDVDFSIPYFITALTILVRADCNITKYQDLAGKKVATIRGSMGDIAIAELVPDAERIRFQRNFEALQALKERRVEAFVQDIQMQGLTGFDLQEELAPKGIQVPVIAVSAHDDAESRERAGELGAAAFFRKPVDGEALIDAINWAMGGSKNKSGAR